MKSSLFVLSPLALALGSVLSVPVMAQDEAAAIEEIVVTGSYAKSLERAVDIKRNNIGFSDSIVATDIADFPEQNLAEALQRMPGVTIERNKGLGSKVNVRSLPSEFTHVSINGLATASGSGGRDVEFDIFASEIIQGVTVQKSPTAADEEGGIAGSVLISTARPFDYNERQLVVSADAAYNSISEKTDPKFSFLASDTFGDWGALVSFSKASRTNRTDSNSGINFRPLSRWTEKKGSSQWQSDQTIEVLARDTGVVISDPFDTEQTNRVVFLDKVGDRAYLNDQDKWGATASLQFKPSETLSLTFDAMLGGYDNTEDEYDAAAYSASSISALEQVHSYDNTTLADYGVVVLTDVSYAATQHEFLSKENVHETDYSQYSLSLDWDVANWQITGLLGYSGAEKLSDTSNLKHVAFAPSRSRYTDTGGETIVSANPQSIDMYNSPDKYLFDSYEVNLEEIQDDKYAAQLDFARPLSLDFLPSLAKVQFGVRYTDKSKQRNRGSNTVRGPAEGDSSWRNTRTLQDSDIQLISDLVPGGRYMKQLDGSPQWSQVGNDYARDTFRYSGFNVDFADSEFYQVDEEVLSLYAMTDFLFDIGHMPVTLNAGVRYVDTSVLSFGYHQVQNSDGSTGYTPEPVSKDGGYQEVLPSANLMMELSDDLMLRAAYSETLMRPALGDIAYKRTVSVNEFKYRDGNPDLKPTYADQWEIGLEYYLENGGLLAVSYFEKTIEGVVRESLTGVVKDVTKYNANGTVDGIYDFDVYQKVNAEGAYDVSGVELIAQFPLSMLHPMLEGFGINANYTMLDNSLTGASDLSIPTPPEGLADKTWNATLYYENAAFDARLSYNYKDKYVEVIERDMYPVYRDAYGQLDLSLGYQLTDDIKVSLEGINITDEETRAYTIAPVFPSMYEFSGRRFSLGVRASF
ncbi:TonB-dependent receptor [Bowmanella yangjiangensis]|uniref:TonB-dependent receptor n=1 Tax=Bowmanella yangjiangensis TaxID=2811230 RepID=A0ABS3CX98_9ALTE|nr:TonB-dependent receptor [Bowmanella yangjiangensis]MBN7821749.1 TonB-dependent receptor [Bowmanella yangjiangensis]